MLYCFCCHCSFLLICFAVLILQVQVRSTHGPFQCPAVPVLSCSVQAAAAAVFPAASASNFFLLIVPCSALLNQSKSPDCYNKHVLCLHSLLPSPGQKRHSARRQRLCSGNYMLFFPVRQQLRFPIQLPHCMRSL